MYSTSESLPGDSRVWVYQCSRELDSGEVNTLAAETKLFLEGWTAHSQALKASFEIRYNRFLILMIDEKAAGASGCSIDKSVHFIQNMEKKLGVTFLDRMKFAYKKSDRVEVVSRDEFENLFSKGLLNPDSIVFNNLVQTKQALETEWELPIKKSWHNSLLTN